MVTQSLAQIEVEPLELRVLAGRVRGANAPLERGRTVVIGHALDSDIVLRDPSAKGVRLTLRTRGDAADLDLTEGEVRLLGHTLVAPAKAVLPTFMPLLIGDNAIAIGEADSPRWPEAERILVAATRQPESEADDAEPAEPPQWQYILNEANAVVSRSSKFVPAAIVAVLAVCILIGMSRLVPMIMDRPPGPGQVEEGLNDAGFTGLQVTQGESGRLVIAGMLPTDEDRSRLRQTVTNRDWPATVTVQTHEDIARGVEDFYMANGMEATARSTGAGLVRLDVRGGSPDEVERLRPLALSEVKGVRRIEVSMLPGTDDATDFADIQEGGGKRVVSVVGGETGHITTVDGSRYFAGAVLPTGHRIVAIEDSRVLVERDGLRSELKF